MEMANRMGSTYRLDPRIERKRLVPWQDRFSACANFETNVIVKEKERINGMAGKCILSQNHALGNSMDLCGV